MYSNLTWSLVADESTIDVRQLAMEIQISKLHFLKIELMHMMTLARILAVELNDNMRSFLLDFCRMCFFIRVNYVYVLCVL